MQKAMKKKVENEEIEILRAVAQAWLGHSGNPRSTKEFDAHRSHYRHRPTRFKLEAMNMVSKKGGGNWDFGQSLWDSYEIVAVSKRLEAGLALDHPMSFNHIEKRRRESKNSLRNLFYRVSSKRFDAVVPKDAGFQSFDDAI
ncbi:uncharacterized protein LOC143891102 [Tasmannia lanceolata]|uniref:uncharacterized protein LOC143891102 n=1 Tax=Tasmannia lanceolata TaxID=3420 RepID=UPI0040630943